MKEIVKCTVIAAGIIILTGCTASSTPMVPQTPDFKAGVNDGCATASGAYTKNSEMFKQNHEYHEGWFCGRKQCNPSNSRQ